RGVGNGAGPGPMPGPNPRPPPGGLPNGSCPKGLGPRCWPRPPRPRPSTPGCWPRPGPTPGWPGCWPRCPGTPAPGAPPCPAAGRRRWLASALHTGDGRAGEHRARRDHDEVVVGDRILEFLAQKPLLDEHVHVRRVGVGELALVEADCMRILQPPEHELLFLF